MKTKLLKLYTIFVSLIFVFSIFLFSFNIFSDYVHGEKNCENRFELLSLNIKKLTTKYDFYTQNFDNNLFEAVNPIEDFAYLKISKNYETYFLYESDENSKNNTSKFIHEQYFSFNANDEIIHIEAKMFLVKPSSIIHYALISFLIILITTIVTFILIIINYNSSKNIFINVDDDTPSKENHTESENENATETEISQHEPKTADEILASIDYSKTKLDLSDSIYNQNTVSTTSTQNLSLESSNITENKISVEESKISNTNNVSSKSEVMNQDSQIKQENEELCPLTENSVDTKLPEFENKVAKTENTIEKSENIDSNNLYQDENNQTTNTLQKTELPSEEIKPMEITNQNLEEPKGLFSEQTGLGWESYFNVRLENELNRAISSEIDLALFLIKLPCIEKNDKVFKEIVDYLSVQFQFKDLLFEYKNDSIAAIKINTNVDEALSFSEKLQFDINDLLKDYPSKCYIGISTRTVRMMSAERLVKEADEALIHAQDDDDCQIIAFRADAAKYRQFIENN